MATARRPWPGTSGRWNWPSGWAASKAKPTARGNRAILLSEQAQETTDPAARLRLLNQAIAEERESLALEQQLGQPAWIAISHNNLAEYLRQLAEAGGTGLPGVDEPDHRQDAGATADHGQDPRATLLDEAEQHALQALAIFERLNSPHTSQTLEILERIAEARGDAAAAAEYRRRKEAAHAEAQQRAGRQGLPLETIVALLQLALTARAEQLDFADALRSAGADDPAALLAAIQQTDPWLAAHLSALATGHARPAAEPPRNSRTSCPKPGPPPPSEPRSVSEWGAVAALSLAHRVSLSLPFPVSLGDQPRRKTFR